MNLTVTFRMNSMSDALRLASALQNSALYTDCTNKVKELAACLDGMPITAVSIDAQDQVR
jgi:hypothetical protein